MGNMDRYADVSWAKSISDAEQRKESDRLAREAYERGLARESGDSLNEQVVDPRAEAKKEATAELEQIRTRIETATREKAEAAAKVKALGTILKGVDMTVEAGNMGKMVADYKAAQEALPRLTAELAEAEPRLKTLEAQYRTRFPEVVN